MGMMTKHYPVEQRQRAATIVLDHLDENRSKPASKLTSKP
jgi:hypothetical protein